MSDTHTTSAGGRISLDAMKNTRAHQPLPGEYRPYPGGPRIVRAKERNVAEARAWGAQRY